MRVVFNGDFRELAEFEKQIEQAPDALRTVNEQLAEETIELIRQGFEDQRDPYGNAWAGHAPLTKMIRPGGRILDDDGHLKAGWHVSRVERARFAVANAKRYSIYAQDGTGVHGPRKKRIEPVHADALAIPVGGGVVFLSSVAGGPQRRMVPDAGDIPTSWREAYLETAQDVLTEIFR